MLQTMNHARQAQQRQQQNHEISNKGPRTPIQDHQSHPMQANIVGASPGGHVRRISSKMPNQSPMSMMSPQQNSTGEPDPKRFKLDDSQAITEANLAQIIAAGQSRPNGNHLINGHYTWLCNRIPVSNKPMPRRPAGMMMVSVYCNKIFESMYL